MRSRWPTRGGAYLPSDCRTCSGSSPGPTATTWGAASPGRAWASPSARGSWRRAGAGYGRRARGRGWERGSPSRYRRSRETASGTAIGLPPLSTLAARGGVERGRVLAVDDDPQALRYVRDALASAGYTPVVTGDPGEALRLVGEEKPACRLESGTTEPD